MSSRKPKRASRSVSNVKYSVLDDNDDDLEKRAEFVHPSELSAADCRVVEKVLARRRAKQHYRRFEYLVKLRGRSYRNLRWMDRLQVEQLGKTSKMVLARYLSRRAADTEAQGGPSAAALDADIDTAVDDDAVSAVNPAWVEVEKIIAKRSVPDKASVAAVAQRHLSAGAGGARRRAAAAKAVAALAAEEDGLGTRHVLSGFEYTPAKLPELPSFSLAGESGASTERARARARGPKEAQKGAVLRKTDRLISSLLGEHGEQNVQAGGAAEEDDSVAAAAAAAVTGADAPDVRATSAAADSATCSAGACEETSSDVLPSDSLLPSVDDEEAAALRISRCSLVLARLRDEEWSDIFDAPVDEADAPGYFEHVSQPMDLGTVEARLRAGVKGVKGLAGIAGGVQLAYGQPIIAYTKVAEAARIAREARHSGDEAGDDHVADAHELFARDVRLVFQNCRHYNEDGSMIHDVAGRMLELFEKYFLRWVVQLRPLDACTDDEEDDDMAGVEVEGETGGNTDSELAGGASVQASTSSCATARDDGESGGTDVDGGTSAAIAVDSATETGCVATHQAASGETGALEEAMASTAPASRKIKRVDDPLSRLEEPPTKKRARPGPREGAYNRSEAQLAAARACGRDLVGASKFIGVTALPAGRYQAQITKDGSSRYLGTFTNPSDAARAFDRAARAFRGKAARLNFPDVDGGELKHEPGEKPFRNAVIDPVAEAAAAAGVAFAPVSKHAKETNGERGLQTEPETEADHPVPETPTSGVQGSEQLVNENGDGTVEAVVPKSAQLGASPPPIVAMKTQFLIKWRDLSYRECTWEDEDAILGVSGDENVVHALRKYERANKMPSADRILAASGQKALQNLNKDNVVGSLGRTTQGRGSVIFPLSYIAPARGRQFSQSMARAQIHAQLLAFSYLVRRQEPPPRLLRACGAATTSYCWGPSYCTSAALTAGSVQQQRRSRLCVLPEGAHVHTVRYGPGRVHAVYGGSMKEGSDTSGIGTRYDVMLDSTKGWRLHGRASNSNRQGRSAQVIAPRLLTGPGGDLRRPTLALATRVSTSFGNGTVAGVGLRAAAFAAEDREVKAQEPSPIPTQASGRGSRRSAAAVATATVTTREVQVMVMDEFVEVALDWCLASGQPARAWLRPDQVRPLKEQDAAHEECQQPTSADVSTDMKSSSKDMVNAPSTAKIDRKVRHCLADVIEHVARNTRPIPADPPVIELDVRLPRDEEHGLGLQITPGERGRGQSCVEIISVTPEIALKSPQHALVCGGDFIVAVAGERVDGLDWLGVVRKVRDTASPVLLRLASRRWPMSPEGALPTSCNVDIAVPCKACYDSDDDDRAWGDKDEEAVFDVFETQTSAEADICHPTSKLSSSSVSVPTAAAAVMSAASTGVKPEHDVDIAAGDDEIDEWKLDFAHPSKMKEAKKYGPEEFLLLSANNQENEGAKAAIAADVKALLQTGRTRKGPQGPRKVTRPENAWGEKRLAVDHAKPAADEDDDAEGAKSKTDGGAESGRFRPYQASPSFFDEGHQLRDYQIDGLNWLLRNFYESRSCILADEMGLGKTVQVVSTCEHLRRRERLMEPFLIVAPLSTLPHWKREFEGWCDMTVCLYHDSGAIGTTARDIRAFIRKHEWFHTDLPVTVPKFDVLIISYESLLADFDAVGSLRWSVCVVDEGHRLKNNQSRLMQQMQLMTCGWRVLLSGTPLQNNTRELWSLLNFIEPRKFGDVGQFMQRYGTVTTQEQVMSLQKELMPHLLRRVKEDVEKDLPPKKETLIDVELTTVQKKYYRAIFEKNRSFLSKGLKGGNAPQLMNVQMQLRKCCNHPFLIRGVEDRELQLLKLAQARNAADTGTDPAPLHELRLKSLIESSGKMVLVDKLLPKLIREGHKTLIFSQMVQMLDLLHDYLELKGYGFERLDGRIAGGKRQASIDRFCSPDNTSTFVFLLSTRAGGLGINLTAADTAIIFDSDWNPQNDLQAQARCHRIGQKKAVTIYRLLARNTFENELFFRASRKLGLETAVLGTMAVGGTDDGVGQAADGRPGASEMQDLLKQGAYHLLDDEEAQERERAFNEADIEQLLEQRARVFVHEERRTAPTLSGRAGHQLAKSSFTADSAAKAIAIDDPDFWQKVLGKDVSANALLVRLRGGEIEAAVTTGGARARDKACKTFLEEVEGLVHRVKEQKDGKIDDSGSDVPMSAHEIEAEIETTKRLLVSITQGLRAAAGGGSSGSGAFAFSAKQRKQAAQWLELLEGDRVRSCRVDLKNSDITDDDDEESEDDSDSQAVEPGRKRGRGEARDGKSGKRAKTDDDDTSVAASSESEKLLQSIKHRGQTLRVGDAIEINEVPGDGVLRDGSGALLPTTLPILAIIDAIRLEDVTQVDKTEGNTKTEPKPKTKGKAKGKSNGAKTASSVHVLEVYFLYHRSDTLLVAGGGSGTPPRGLATTATVVPADDGGWHDEVYMTFQKHANIPLQAVDRVREVVFCARSSQAAWLARRDVLPLTVTGKKGKAGAKDALCVRSVYVLVSLLGTNCAMVQ